MSERLLQDIHPVEVYAPGIGTTPREARAFVTTTRVVVHIEATDKGTDLWFESPITGALPEANRGSLQGQIHLATVAGDVHISRGRGCGCHSPLKLLSPPVSW